MFMHVVKAKYVKDYEIELLFNDGKKGVVDLKNELWGEVFEPLKDIEYFRNFELKLNTISWKNGADIAPEFLYEKLIL